MPSAGHDFLTEFGPESAFRPLANISRKFRVSFSLIFAGAGPPRAPHGIDPPLLEVRLSPFDPPRVPPNVMRADAIIIKSCSCEDEEDKEPPAQEEETQRLLDSLAQEEEIEMVDLLTSRKELFKRHGEASRLVIIWRASVRFE